VHLTSAVGGDEWPFSCLGRFTQRECALFNYRIGRWLQSWCGLCGEKKISVVCKNQTSVPCHTTHSLVTKNWLIPAVLHNKVTRDNPSIAIKETLKSQWKKFKVSETEKWKNVKIREQSQKCIGPEQQMKQA